MRGVLLVALVVSCGYTPSPSPTIDAPAGGGISIPDDAPLPADQRCTARYKTLDTADYQLCTFTETTCTFYVHTNGDCMTACTSVGGTCIESRDGDCVDANHSTQLCNDVHSDQVCTCSN